VVPPWFVHPENSSNRNGNASLQNTVIFFTIPVQWVVRTILRAVDSPIKHGRGTGGTKIFGETITFETPGRGLHEITEPIAEAEGTVIVDGKPIPIRGVDNGVRVHRWGNARRCMVAVQNYRESRPALLRIRIGDGTRCRFEAVLGKLEMERSEDRSAVLCVPAGDATAVLVERE